jgi:Domain of unknown function (DUF4349)
MKTFHVLMILAVVAMVGCGEAGNAPGYKGDSPAAASMMKAQEESPRAKQGMGRGAGNQPEKPQAGDAAVERKIIRTADVSLIVKDFEIAQQDLRALINQFKDCYIAQAEITGSTGSPRRGHWKVRVPARDFDAFREAAAKLGVPERDVVDSQDVTEEYYDLETRTKNKKVEEQRLLKHLEKSTAKLEEILAVEREISRVRGEIEQQEGRLRLLANLTALTTVSITLQENKNYVPPQAPAFTASISSTFSGSIDLLISCGKGLTLVVVALAPWLPVLALAVLVIWALVRRHARRAPTQVQAS